MPADNQIEDIFARFVDQDEGWLREQWESITAQLADIRRQQHDLRAQSERLEARLSVLDGIAQLRKVELQSWEPGAADVGRPVSPKDVCLDVLRSSEVEWTAPALHQKLAERGAETSRSNVRMILRRLVDEGLVQHVARGRYRASTPYAVTPAMGSSAATASPVAP